MRERLAPLPAALAVAAALIFVAGAALQARAENVDLKIEVSGLRNYKGSVVLALWPQTDQTRHFPDATAVQLRDERPADVPCDFSKAAVCRRTVGNLQDLTVSYTFRDVPQGDYAVFVFHDENNNGILDTGFMHRPMEARGFSQLLPDDISPIGARIGFTRAHFTLTAPRTIVIGLRYPPRL
jgi:uncharacterized protein (DUF2141 family)